MAHPCTRMAIITVHGHVCVCVCVCASAPERRAEERAAAAQRLPPGKGATHCAYLTPHWAALPHSSLGSAWAAPREVASEAAHCAYLTGATVVPPGSAK